MDITLIPEQEAWLHDHVVSGEFASVEDAVRKLIDDQITQQDLEGDELAWAKPMVDEGIAAYERGDFITLEERRKRRSAQSIAMKR